MPPRSRPVAILLAAALGVLAPVGLAPTTSAAGVPDGTRFAVATPDPAALAQIKQLTAQGRTADAARVRALVRTPTAEWVTERSTADARRKVDRVTRQAAAKTTVPVLVLYNLPFRDCSQYSAGGARSVAEYKAWVDAVARGIGSRRAVVAVEPDGLGIIPWHRNLDGSRDWCRPAGANAGTAAADRFALLRYAVQRLSALPKTSVYLDATQPGWLSVGEASSRLVRAGVGQADGMFLNTSNFHRTANVEQYGTWISSCLAYVTRVRSGDYAACPNQFWNGGPTNGWRGRSLDPQKTWSDTTKDAAANTAGINARYKSLLGKVRPTKTFLVDTSRNGRGPWQPTGTPATGADPQTWCNPPGRGAGTRPTTRTGTGLADAYVWIKVPGQSDGQCSRGLGSGNRVVDPFWKRVDPPAGSWFPAQALQLAALAKPALVPAR